MYIAAREILFTHGSMVIFVIIGYFFIETLRVYRHYTMLVCTSIDSNNILSNNLAYQ